MGFRLYRRVGIAPGIRINLSRSGPSLSLGKGPLHYTVGTRGTRTTLGIPGTGMYYTKQHAWGSSAMPPPSAASATSTPATGTSHGLAWWLFVLPAHIIVGLLYLLAFLCGAAAVALVAYVVVGIIALAAGWPYAVGAVLVVVAFLFGLLWILGTAMGASETH